MTPNLVLENFFLFLYHAPFCSSHTYLLFPFNIVTIDIEYHALAV